LICGDVGYGKTEVAMRAAFKAIDSGKQVAVLVPTTVLAEQHFRSFTERMAEYPFTIEVLSRFRTKSEQQRILAGLKSGSVDLVVGTHRLVQPDVKIHELGLVVVDEEQRFGVDAKEMLKKLRMEVDVLTLSATPIPRTLHLSLLGIRDISNLETPPHDRLAIETRICRFDGELIRQAIVRELNRGGQVYFVHNRVYNIQQIADRLQQIVPEAEIGIVHGQMPEHELEDAMYGFVSGRVDVLVATTIIESGLDIPNANTIFIHEADRYGLADMHQLRGRVGRYKHRAYCYLLLEEGRSLTTTAARRLKAIEEFSELGAGFKIAMRDLEIRGAGNILGTEQSGHIASVGYELYCQLLENAVRQLKNEPLRETRHVAVNLPISAYLPGAYVPPGRHKIDVYRRLSRVSTQPELAELTDELRDRFGPIPPEAALLFELKELQLLAQGWQIDDIHLEDRFAVFGYRNPRQIEKLGRRWGDRLRVVDQRSAYLVLEDGEASPHAILALLKSVLQP
jgi:transcription-repair coupling factor (superfamily II helicase)